MTEGTRQPNLAVLAGAALVGGTLVLAGAVVALAATGGMGAGMMGMPGDERMMGGMMMDPSMMERMEAMHAECMVWMQTHRDAEGNMTAGG